MSSCVFTAAMVTRTFHNVTLYVHWIILFILS